MYASSAKRYLVAIIPPQPILDEIKLMKENMALRFESRKALQSPAHITLVLPFEPDMEEEELGVKLRDFAIQELPFKLILNGYACFANRRFPVIYVKPEANERLNLTQAAIEESLFSGHIIPSKMPFAFSPHITIAYRDLTPANFKKAWPEMESLEYKREFEVRSLFLLRWNFYFNRWDILQEHKFGAEQLVLM